MNKGRPRPNIRILNTVDLMLKDGMNYSEIGRSMGRTRQVIRYWAGLIHSEVLPNVLKNVKLKKGRKHY